MVRLGRYTLRIVAAAILLTGCSEDVTAVLGTDRPYSLFGVLSPQLDSQWVRVFPVEGTLEPATLERLDASFVSVELETKEKHVWRDSVIQDINNQNAHVFWAPFRAEHDHSYRLTVTRSDGAEASVEVAVPPRTEVVLRPPEIAPVSVTLPVLIKGEAPRLIRVEVIYAISYKPVDSEVRESDDVSVSYEGEPLKTEEGWVVPIKPTADFTTVADILVARLGVPFDRNIGLTLLNLTLRLIVASEEWNPPNGEFDPDVLIQPGTLTNVENGFGFVGAGYRHAKQWIPPDEAVEAAGFRTQH